MKGCLPKMKFTRFQSVLLALFLLAGCATDETPATYYMDENGRLSTGEGLATELQLIARAMTHSMTPTVHSGKNMRFPPKWPSKEKPLAIIAELDNRTQEFMDSKIITDAIHDALRSHGVMQIYEDVLPLPEKYRQDSQNDRPEWSPLLMDLAFYKTTRPLGIPEKKPLATPTPLTSVTEKFQQAPLQPAPVRMSTLHVPPAPETASPLASKTVVLVDITEAPMPSTSPTRASRANESGEPATVMLATLIPSPQKGKPVESREQRRTRILGFLEARLKEGETEILPAKGAPPVEKRGYVPIYVIKTVLFPSVVSSEDEAPYYLFKTFVEDIRSGTVKWASIWEAQKKTTGTHVVNNSTGNSYRAPIPAEKPEGQGNSTLSGISESIRDIKDATQTVFRYSVGVGSTSVK
jgi:hypothetical protein